MGGPKILCQIFKTGMLHVTVTKKRAVSPVTNGKHLCHMLLTILGPMSHVKLKKSPVAV